MTKIRRTRKEIGTRPISNSFTKIVERLERKALIPNQNNSSDFGVKKTTGGHVGQSRCEVNFIPEVEEDDLLVNKNDPENYSKTAYSHQEFEEYGFHVITP